MNQVVNPIIFDLSLRDNLSSALTNVTLFYFLEKARKMATEFEKQMANANSIFLESIQNYQKMTQEILNLGGKTSKHLSDVAKSLYNLASAGLKSKEAIDVLKNSLKFAEATGDNIDRITEAVAKFSRGFKISFTDSAEIVKEFANLINKTQIKFKDIFSAMKFATQIGALFPKQELSDILTALGLLVNRGIPASAALRQLRSVMIDLTKPTSKLTKFLEKYGFTLDEISPRTNKLVDILAKFQEKGVTASDVIALFGKRASGSFKILMDEGVPAFLKLKNEITELNTLQQQVEKQNDSLARKQAKFFSYMEKIFNKMSRIKNYFLKEFFDAFQTLSDWLSGHEGLENTLTFIGELFTIVFYHKAIKSLVGVINHVIGLKGWLTKLVPVLSAIAIGYVAVHKAAKAYYESDIKYAREVEKNALNQASKLKTLLDLEKLYNKNKNETLAIQIEILKKQIIIDNYQARLEQKRKDLAKYTKEFNDNLEKGFQLVARSKIDLSTATMKEIKVLEKKIKVLKEEKEEQEKLLKKEKKINTLISEGVSLYKTTSSEIEKTNKKIREYRIKIHKLNVVMKNHKDKQKEITVAIKGYQDEITRLQLKAHPEIKSFFNDFSDLLLNNNKTLDDSLNFLNKYFGGYSSSIDFLIGSVKKLGDSFHELSIREQQEMIFLKYKEGAISAADAIMEMAKVSVEKSDWMKKAMMDYANELAKAVDTQKIDNFNSKIDETLKKNNLLVDFGVKMGLSYEQAKKMANSFFNDVIEKSTEANKTQIIFLDEQKSAFEKVKEFYTDLRNSMKSWIYDTLHHIKSFKDAWNGVKGFLGNFLKWYKNKILMQIAEGWANNLTAWLSKFLPIPGVGTTSGINVVTQSGGIANIFGGLFGGGRATTTASGGMLGGLLNGVKNLFGGSGTSAAASGGIMGALSSVVPVAAAYAVVKNWDTVKNAIVSPIKGIGHAVSSVAHGVGHAVSNVWHGITGLFHHHHHHSNPYEKKLNAYKKLAYNDTISQLMGNSGGIIGYAERILGWTEKTKKDFWKINNKMFDVWGGAEYSIKKNELPISTWKNTFINNFTNRIKGLSGDYRTIGNVMLELIKSMNWGKITKYHTGGFVRQDEYPAILQKGEVVLPKNIVKNMLYGTQNKTETQPNKIENNNIYINVNNNDKINQLVDNIKNIFGYNNVTLEVI